MSALKGKFFMVATKPVFQGNLVRKIDDIKFLFRTNSHKNTSQNPAIATSSEVFTINFTF